MSSPFDVFNHPFLLKVIHPVKGIRNQTTGNFTPATQVTTTITGSFDRPTSQGAHGLIYEDHGMDGTLEVGEMRLFTSAAVALEDRVKVYFDALATESLSKSYRVKGIVKDYDWLDQFITADNRVEYALVPEEPSR